MRVIIRWIAVAGLALAASTAPAACHSANDRGAVTTHKVAGHIWSLYDCGGNMTALIGTDGTLLVDDEFGPQTPAILAKLKSLGGTAPRIVVNTHYHRDHTGGNASMRAAGAIVIAQSNVYARLAQGQRTPAGASTPEPIPAAGLPMATFERAMTLHFDGETVVIPGPGAVADKAALVRFRNMMAAVRDNVRKLIDEGKTLEQIQAAHPTAAYDAKWDGHGISAGRFVAEVYYSLRPHFVGT